MKFILKEQQFLGKTITEVETNFAQELVDHIIKEISN